MGNAGCYGRSVTGMAFEPDHEGRRDSGRLPKPAVPPEFQERAAGRGTPQAASELRGGTSAGGWRPTNAQSMGTARGQQPWGGYGPAPQGQQPYGQPPYVQPPYGKGPYAPWPAPRRQGHAVRNILAGVGGAFAVGIAIIVVAVANSAGHTMRDTGTTSGPGGSDTSSASAPPASAPKKATIGTTITLSGYRGGEQMGVTVVKMIDHA